MMINKRLIGTVRESKKYIAGNVICQWISLAANITMMGVFSITMPAGLGLYWTISNIFGIVQQVILTKYYRKKFEREAQQ